MKGIRCAIVVVGTVSILCAKPALAQKVKLRGTYEFEEAPFALAFNPDDKLLAVGGSAIPGNGIIWLRDLTTGKDKIVFAEATRVHSIAFHPNGRWLASATESGTTSIWNVSTGRQEHALPGDKYESISKIAFSANGKLLASAGGGVNLQGLQYGFVRLWDATTFKEIVTLRAGKSALSMVFSRDSSLLLSGDEDGRVRIWDVATRKENHIINAYARSVGEMAVSPDDKLLALRGIDVEGAEFSTVSLWDLAKGKKISTLERHNDTQVTSLAFSPDGKLLASGGADDRVRLWNTGTAKEITTIKADGSAIVFSHDGKLLALDQGYSVKVWQVPSSKPVP